MSNIRFFEKPGCTGNARQKALLQGAGHTIESFDILTYQFTKDELRSYFTSQDTADWFNKSAPAIKNGNLDISSLSEADALDMMMSDHILIRRPLIEVNGMKFSGFDIDLLEKHGVNCKETPRFKLLDGQDLDQCPGDQMGIKCDTPRTIEPM
jgi:nitrogenase-associated protein